MKWLHEHGIDADVIVGAKTKDLVILEDKFKSVAGNLYVTTDDGSYGFHGYVDALVRRELAPVGFQLEKPTIEDIILALVKGEKQ